MQVHRVIVGFECRSSLPSKDSAETAPHRSHRAPTGLLSAAFKERKHYHEAYAECSDEFTDEYDDDEFFEDEHDNLTASWSRSSSSFSGSPPTPSSCASSDPIPIPYKRLGYPYWAIVRGVVPPRHTAVSSLQVQTTCAGQVQRSHATTHSSKHQQQQE